MKIFLLFLFITATNFVKSQSHLFYYDSNIDRIYTIGTQYKIKLIYDGILCKDIKLVNDSVDVVKVGKCEYVLMSNKKTEGGVTLFIKSENDNVIRDSLKLYVYDITKYIEFDLKNINKSYLDAPFQNLDNLIKLEINFRIVDYLTDRLVAKPNELTLETIKFKFDIYDKSGHSKYSTIKTNNNFSYQERKLFKDMQAGEYLTISDIDYYVVLKDRKERGQRMGIIYQYEKKR